MYHNSELVSNDAPLVSVIIPCYSQGRFLSECIQSLQAQTYPHWEAIIVNDGSPDNTAEVAASLCSADPRIRYIEKQNGGLSSARNAGIDAAHGKWIQFLDADDGIHPKKFELQIKGLVKTDEPGISFSSYRNSKENSLDALVTPDKFTQHQFKEKSPLIDLAMRWETDLSIPVHCFLVSSELIHKNNIRFDTTLPTHEDWDFWMQIFTLNPPIHQISYSLAMYRLHQSSLTRNIDKMATGFYLAIEKQIKLNQDNPVLANVLNEKLNYMKWYYEDQRWLNNAGRLSLWLRSNLHWYARRFFKNLRGIPL